MNHISRPRSFSYQFFAFRTREENPKHSINSTIVLTALPGTQAQPVDNRVIADRQASLG